MRTKKEISAYIKAIEMVDEEIAPKNSRIKTWQDGLEEIQKTGNLTSSPVYFSSNHELITEIKNLGEVLKKSKEQGLNGDSIELSDAFEDKVSEWITLLATQTKSSEIVIRSRVNVKKEEVFKNDNFINNRITAFKNLFS